MVPSTLTRDNANEYFLANEEALRLIGTNTPKKLVYVPGRLLNAVV